MNARRRLADVARGIVPADLVLTHGRVFDVLSGDFVDAGLAIYGDRIAGIGAYQGLQTLDVRGRSVLPGFIDAGAVLEASHLGVAEYARVVSAHGTTAAVFDFRAIAAVLGLRGLVGVLTEGKRAPIDVFCAAPLFCGRRWDTAATCFDALDSTLLSLPGLVARGGELDGRALLETGGAVLASGTDAPYLPAIVEAAGLTESEGAALAALGAVAVRQWDTPEEALTKLRQGLWLLAAEGTITSSVADLKWLARYARLDRVCLVTGACSAADLAQNGHLDAALRQAVRAGIPASEAIRLVTMQPAQLLGMHERGALLPGRRADVVVVDDVRNFSVNLVIKDGRPIARQGASLLPAPASAPSIGRLSMRPAVLLADHLAIRGHAGVCRVIGLDGSGATTLQQATPAWSDGVLQADPASDLLKVAVAERHTASGRLGLGFVQGLGLAEGAMCCSFAGSGQNLIVAGADDESMLQALQQVVADGGGMAVVRAGQVTASVALPYAGLLSALPAAALIAAVHDAEQAAWDLGCDALHPFLALASLADTSTGDLRITEQGLVDVLHQRLLPIQD